MLGALLSRPGAATSTPSTLCADEVDLDNALYLAIKDDYDLWPLLPNLPLEVMFNATSAARRTISGGHGGLDTFKIPKRMVVFGDSLSDTGNTFKETLGFFPPRNFYYSGHFSNGQIWVERVAKMIGIAAQENYAHGGAVSSQNPFSPARPTGESIIPSIDEQVDLLYLPLLKKRGKLRKNALATPANGVLFTVFAGANDYLNAVKEGSVETIADSLPLAVVRSILASVDRLYSLAGARHILLVNVPPLHQTPRFNKPEMAVERAALKKFISVHNNAMAQEVAKAQQRWPGAKVDFFDVASLTEQVLLQPARFNFTRTAEACLEERAMGLLGGRLCEEPHNTFFWDDVHPSWRVHDVISNAVFDLITKPQTKQAATSS
ncbi:GDSL-like Lipase/Acylhydrolase-domain-containing protein [Thamnocephalis sphaerospora]|uniref:GDSL-like Lipase/Acylhydrolase-domain-containing protein n=1 Tax=Thamnocephalis sphaerospora TaxID=78915 RepID=A0A4P9XWZ4_9FUNG|nr:GDSL-like Lipase/Acylhydrolase-domain-containing protein [Thamnocephalis sphaerospora]|eukprot:RKP09960.1 GDSL-like Lipase/Acylhydrolase-domain-containing protein [Thamnocephalis sphaerospora]